MSSFQKLQAERYFVRTSRQTICSSETADDRCKGQSCKNIPSEKARDYFSLVANLLGDFLINKSIAVWQRS